jgi:hypothetical protein
MPRGEDKRLTRQTNHKKEDRPYQGVNYGESDIMGWCSYHNSAFILRLFLWLNEAGDKKNERADLLLLWSPGFMKHRFLRR